MPRTNRNSGTLFFTVSDYNRYQRGTSRRSDSSFSDVESIQSSQAGEQGSTGDCISTPRTEGEILSSPNLKAFSFSELKCATRNFRPDSLIGIFGRVYKGWIDEQTFTASKPGVGMVVAVKKHEKRIFQCHNEWLTEVRYLGQLHHPNLLKLIGFCLDSDNRDIDSRLLVYEFMPRGSLENHLFRRDHQPLSWATRIKVAIGAAKVLAFVHDAESQVMHQGVKSSSILLDSDFNAKLSGFGFARDTYPTEDMELAHVFPQVMGTYIYAAPEYLKTGDLSAKADVYSFGVVLLELLSGLRAYDTRRIGIKKNLVYWLRAYLGYKREPGYKRELLDMVDSKLEGQYPLKAAHAMAKLALLCIDDYPGSRPSMSKVLAGLEKLQDL